MKYFLIASYIEQYSEDNCLVEIIQCETLESVAENMLERDLSLNNGDTTVFYGEQITDAVLDPILKPLREAREKRWKEEVATIAAEQERQTYERLKAKYEPADGK